MPGSVLHKLRNWSNLPRSVRLVPKVSVTKSVRSRPWSYNVKREEGRGVVTVVYGPVC